MKKSYFSSVKLALIVLLFIVSIVVSITSFVWFKDNNYKQVINNNIEYQERFLENLSENIYFKLSDTEDQIRQIAKIYSKMSVNMDFYDLALLQTLNENSPFEYISYVGLDCIGHSIYAHKDVCNMEAVRLAFNGHSGSLIERFELEKGDYGFTFYAPVIYENVIRGALIAQYNVSHLQGMLNSNLFGFPARILLVNNKGDILIKSDFDDPNYNDKSNILDINKKNKYEDEMDEEKLRVALETPNNKIFSYKIETEWGVAIWSVVKPRNYNFNIVQSLHPKITSNLVEEGQSCGFILEVILVSVFIGYIIMLFFIYRSHSYILTRAIEVATRSLSQTLESEKAKTEVISGMSRMYYSCYMLDLENNSMFSIDIDNETYDTIKNQTELKNAVSQIVVNEITSSHLEQCMEFLNLDTFDDRLSDEISLSEEFLTNSRGWVRISIIKLGSNLSEYKAMEPLLMEEIGQNYVEILNQRKALTLNGQQKENKIETTQVKKILLVFQDIDKEKKKEIEHLNAIRTAHELTLKANAAKSDFLAKMSHDIRTPMNAILGMTTIAKLNSHDKTKVQDCLNKITIAGEHLLMLLNDVLDMSKIESGKIDLNVKKFRIRSLLDSINVIVTPQIQNKNHRYITNFDGIIHEVVEGDFTRLQQVLLNIIANAIKYTPDNGEIKFSLTEHNTNKKNIACLEFEVEDNGIGMTEDFIAHIFDPFSRANDDRVNEIQGTGLGMSITYSIVQLMNGNIKVYSKPNCGSKFVVTVYLKCLTSDIKHLDQAFEDNVALSSTEGNGATNILSSYVDDLDKSTESDSSITKSTKEDTEIVTSDLDSDKSEKGDSSTSSSSNDDNDLMFSGIKCLLVEDNALNAEIAIELLSMQGIEVDRATNGKEALDIMTNIDEGYYDIIFMDIQMPIMNGFEATKSIRSLPSNYTKSVPIIAMSANAYADDVHHSIDVGMNAHISKPIDLKVLYATISKFVRVK